MKKAFTLIELLIVIAIIAILALIAIPNFLEAQVRANVSRAQADMRSLATAIEAYTVDFRVPPLAQMTKGDSVWQAYSWALSWESAAMNPPRGCAFGLTTPIAYMSGRLPFDPFLEKVFDNQMGQPRGKGSYTFFNVVGQYNAQQLLTWDKNVQHAIALGPNMTVYFNGTDIATATSFNISWALACAGPDRTLMEPDPRGSPPNPLLNTTYMLWQHQYWDNHGSTCLYDPTNGTVSAGNVWRFSGGGGK